MQRPFVCVCVCVCVCACVHACVRAGVPPFSFDTTVGLQPNLAHIMWIDLGIIRVHLN